MWGFIFLFVVKIKWLGNIVDSAILGSDYISAEADFKDFFEAREMHLTRHSEWKRKSVFQKKGGGKSCSIYLVEIQT